MRRLLAALVALLTVAPATALAQWGEAPVVASPENTPATCLRSAGEGFVSALGRQGPRYGAALFAASPGGLQPQAEVVFGRRVVDCPVAAADSSGAAVVAAPMAGPPPGERSVRKRYQRLAVAVRDPGAAFGEAAELGRMLRRTGWLAPSVDVAADGTAVVAWREYYGALRREDRSRLRIRVATRRPGEPFGAPQTLFDGAHSLWATDGDVVARLDAAGGATVAWARPQGTRNARGGSRRASIEVATASPGARFGSPVAIAEDVGDSDVVGLAVAPDGRAMLVHDADHEIVVHERAPGSEAFGAPVIFRGADQFADRPAVALAGDGSAVVAWREGKAVDAVGRTADGPWQAVTRVQRPPSREVEGALGFGAYAFSSPPIDHDDGTPRVAATSGGGAMVSWINPTTRTGGPARAWVATGSAGTFAPAAPLGSTVRDADGVTPVRADGDLAVAWTDNRDLSVNGLPQGDGQLHLAGASWPRVPQPAPQIRVTARAQSLHFGEPLEVRVRCDAACDLRAVIPERRLSGDVGRRRDGPAGPSVGVGGRDDAGSVTVRLNSTSGNHVAPPGGGPVRVTVRATAPGGDQATRQVRTVTVRRRPVPPVREVLDLRARRSGDDVIVTWRTDGPARRMWFFLFARETRGRDFPVDAPYAQRRGRGDRRFRIRLRDAKRERFVVFAVAGVDPPGRSRTVVIPIR